MQFKKKLLRKKLILKSILFLRIKANSAVTGAPLGSTLGQYGIPAASFCKLFNEKTSFIKSNVLLNVTLFLTVSGEYKFNLTPPTNSFFFKRSLNLVKSIQKPGIRKYFLLHVPKLIVSPYLVYEIFISKEKISLLSKLEKKSSIKKLKGLLYSMGIHILQY